MFRPVRLLPTSLSSAMVKTVTIQMLIGCVIYAGTTVLSFWFPITGVIVIFLSQALWIVVSVSEDAFSLRLRCRADRASVQSVDAKPSCN
jgi:hypothetical protein